MSVPSPNRRRAVTLLAALPWPAVLFQFLAVLPRYDKMFREFGLQVRSGSLRGHRATEAGGRGTSNHTHLPVRRAWTPQRIAV